MLQQYADCIFEVRVTFCDTRSTVIREYLLNECSKIFKFDINLRLPPSHFEQGRDISPFVGVGIFFLSFNNQNRD